MEAPEFIIESMEFIQSSTVLSPDKLHQMAFGKFINDSIDDGSAVHRSRFGIGYFVEC